MKIIDLTQPIYDGMPVYPGDPEVRIKETHDFASYNYLLRTLTMGTHTGTHVDAFSHMDQNGKNLDEIEIERFIGKAMKVKPDAIFPLETGLIFETEIDSDYFEKIQTAKAPFVAGNITEDLERKLLQHQIITYTNLVNLDELPYHTSFLFVGLPLKIKNGDGSPVRAIAVLDI